MLVCTRPSMTILYNSYQTTLAGLGNLAGTAIKELYTYVVDLDLLVCGPQYWFYYGMGDSPFTLEIALPVEGHIPTAVLPHFRQLPSFRCLSHRYQGPWQGLSGAYAEMIKHIQANGLSMNGVSAESYLHIDRSLPENNITEIQIGLF